MSIKKDLTKFFLVSFKTSIEMMTSSSLKVKEMVKSENIFEHNRPGVSSIVGFIDKGLKGRSLLWVPSQLAIDITEMYVGERLPDYKEELVLFTIGEINNVLSGHSTSKMNNEHNLDLRLTPPNIFAGESLSMVTPKLDSYSLLGSLNNEDIFLDIALEGERLHE